MLTRITLKDYTTFISETIFDFNATNYKILEDTNVGANRVLKGALFVGENASGKTQVLKSLTLLLDLLLENAEQNFIFQKSMYTKGTKYSLGYEFNIDASIINYNVEFEGNSINSEKLFVNNELKIDRIKNNGNIYIDTPKEHSDINPALSLVKLEYYNTRFNNDKVLNKWFAFLKNSIYMNCLSGITKSYNIDRVSEQFIVKYAEKNNDVAKLNDFISKFGYNSEIVFNKQVSNKDKTMLINSDKETICIKKRGTEVAMPLQLESSGNKAFINAILPIKFSTLNDCMIIVDEFSSGLHNELEEALIKYFFNNSKNSQIFFTSHSTNLIDTSIVRPDQVYSFRFDSKKGTLINRFSDENPRESQNMEKMYLNGIFNGMPKYNKEFKD